MLRENLTEKNDKLILELINSPLYDVRSNGIIYTRISKTGKVFVDPTKWREAGSTKKEGYREIGYNNAKLAIHRIIFAKFGNIKLKKELVINHKDGNTCNNDISNLELVSTKENIIHSYRVLKRPPVIGNAVLNWELVRKIRKEYETLKTPYRLMAKKYNISKGHISEIINNNIWIEGKEYSFK